MKIKNLAVLFWLWGFGSNVIAMQSADENLNRELTQEGITVTDEEGVGVVAVKTPGWSLESSEENPTRLGALDKPLIDVLHGYYYGEIMKFFNQEEEVKSFDQVLFHQYVSTVLLRMGPEVEELNRLVQGLVSDVIEDEDGSRVILEAKKKAITNFIRDTFINARDLGGRQLVREVADFFRDEVIKKIVPKGWGVLWKPLAMVRDNLLLCEGGRVFEKIDEQKYETAGNLSVVSPVEYYGALYKR